MTQITELTAQMIENNLLGTHFTISDEEMESAKNEGNRVDGKWAKPYLRMTGRLKSGVARRAYGDGQKSDFTSFASCHPAIAAYTMHVTLDLNAMNLVELSHKGHSFGHGFCENGMSLRGLGMFLCLMLPTPDKKWRLIGHIVLDSRHNRTPMIFIEHPERLPAPNEKGRVYLVARNYEMIERSRLTQTVERNGRVERIQGANSTLMEQSPEARFRQTRTAPTTAFSPRATGLDIQDLSFGDSFHDHDMRDSDDHNRPAPQRSGTRHRAPWEREAPVATRASSPAGQRTPPRVVKSDLGNLKF